MEAIKVIKSKSQKVDWGALKLDLSEAFDRVEWNLLGAIFSACGFSD